MQQKKILVVLTGGTIGSVIDDAAHTIQTDSKSTYRLLRAYEDNFGVNNDFLVEQPYNTLSEDIDLGIWNQLCRYIQSKNLSDYAGVIITHGTDTYSYTAALLATLFENYVDIPIVLVSSNYAIGELFSNGLSNFRNAVCFIQEQTGAESGVFCIYENNKGVSEVFCGAEITEADTCVDQFGVFGGEVYGIMEAEHFIRNEKHNRRCLPYVQCDYTKAENPICFTKDVLLLKNYPGLNYDYIGIHRHTPAAVVQYLYHSATACVNSEKSCYSFITFAQRCNAEGVTVYAAGFKKNIKNEYATMKAYEKADIVELYDCSPEAAYANALILENMEKSS